MWYISTLAVSYTHLDVYKRQVQMVLAGKVGKGLVGYIQSMGGKAIGLCGMDGHMIEARKLDDVHG